MRVDGGKLAIDQDGKIAKFVDKVDQVSFSGPRALLQGQEITCVTERCVARLTPEGLVVTEIAPGLDLKRDVLDQAATELRVADDLKTMDDRLFHPDQFGLSL